MSFLFGWTKYFKTNKEEEKDDDNDNDIIDNNNDNSIDANITDNLNNNNSNIIPNNNDNNNIDNDDPTDNDDNDNNDDDNKYASADDGSDSDSDSDNDLLGGPFDSLEEEIKFLRSQNDQLKEKVKYHKSQTKLFRNCNNIPSSDVIKMKINGKLVNVRKPHTNISLDELSQKVHDRLPKFLQKADQSTRNDTIYIPSDVEGEVGIIDIKTVDWWDMVQYDNVNTNDALSTFNDNDNNLQYEDTVGLNGPFIVLREQDVIDAIACFVAQCVMKIPECRDLDHEEMMNMINGTFIELKEKGPLGKMLDWGNFLYLTYGWTSTAYTVYSNAAMAKTILSCFVSAAWIIGVL